MATTVGIVGVLLFETVEFFAEVPIVEFLTGTEWTPLFANPKFGVWPLVLGTLLVSGIAMAVALPLGLLSAVYLSEYAPPPMRRILKPVLEVLAGVPTVVYGYFALLFVTPLLQSMMPSLSGFNALSPGIVMGIMILPLVSSLAEDAMQSVPNGLREGAYALGATRMQTALTVVVPAAFSGITAAFILAVSRAVGETMIVAIAAGQQPRATLDPRVPIETMTAYIVQVSMGDTPAGTLEYRTIFAVGMLLFVGTFGLNLAQHVGARAVSRGVLMASASTAPIATPDIDAGIARRRTLDLAFQAVALFVLLLVLAALAALVYYGAARRPGRAVVGLPDQLHVAPGLAVGHPPGPGGQHLHHRAHRGHRAAGRRGGGHLPRGVRDAQPDGPAHRAQHRQPGGRAVDHLRAAGAGAVRARCWGSADRSWPAPRRWRCWCCRW